MATTDRLSASDQMALKLACEAFSDATTRFHAEPRVGAPGLPESADAAVRFSFSEKQFDMPVAIAPNASVFAVHNRERNAITRLNAATLRTASDRPVMVIAPHVTPRLAEKLIAEHIPFLDTAGNVYIDEPEATVIIVGREHPRLKHTDTTSRSTTPKGLRVSFALATHLGLVQEPYRTIAEKSGVALNTVNLAVDDLVARSLVVRKNGQRMIADRRRFVEDWASQYPTRLRTKLGARRYSSGVDLGWWREAPLSDFDARLGGECGAEILTHENKPVSATLYVHGGAPSSLMKAARLRPDPHGEIEILETFWPRDVEEDWDIPRNVVHPLLVLADLSASGDSRNHAVARTIYERFLAS